MKTLQILFLTLLLGLSCAHGALGAGRGIADVYVIHPVARYAKVLPQAVGTPLPEAAIQDGSAGFSIAGLWALTEKAGPLRWPIFVVFVIGIFLVIFKLFELISDRRESRKLEDANFRNMGLQQIVRIISDQRESMMSRLHAIILNVYQSQKGGAGLQDEISNYVQFQQGRFDTFRKRVDFLSDTAGALGLLGTVWGIFSVFSQRLLDDQTVLTGMGIALITTLLGLVVSIILNLSSTEIFGLFNRRLDRIAAKSDELRFRLMELVTPAEDTLRDDYPHELSVSPAPVSTSPYAPPNTIARAEEPHDEIKRRAKTMPGKPAVPARSSPPAEVKPIAQVEAVFEDRFTNNSAHGDAAATSIRKPLIDSRQEERPEPHALQLLNAVQEDVVGKRLKNLCLKLVDEAGRPVPGHRVAVMVVDGEGLLNDLHPELQLKTDAKGEVWFDWKLGIRAGKQSISASAPDSEAEGTRLLHAVDTRPGVPRKLKQFGNNQGGAAGEFLSKPLKVQVLDEFENPIPEWPVLFAVELGGGSFENGKPEIKVKTNADGDGIAMLRVGKDPGFNTAKAVVEGVVKQLKFQAMSMA